jgi:hypothetical protein
VDRPRKSTTSLPDHGEAEASVEQAQEAVHQNLITIDGAALLVAERSVIVEQAGKIIEYPCRDLDDAIALYQGFANSLTTE